MSRADRPLAATAGLLLVAWVVILGVVVGLGWLITHPLQSSVDPWDNDVSRWFADQRTSALDAPGDFGTLLGETVVGLAVAAVVALGFSLWRRSWRPALFYVLAEAGIGGLYFVATHVISRQRPPVKILDAGLVPDHSFPSGHVATAVVAYGGIVVLAWVYARRSRRWRRGSASSWRSSSSPASPWPGRSVSSRGRFWRDSASGADSCGVMMARAQM